MSEGEKSSEVTKVDKETFKKQVDQFVNHHRQKQQALIKEGKRRNLSLDDMISKSPKLPDEAVEGLFSDDLLGDIPQEVISEVYETLKAMQGKVNSLDPKRRFYILETINFFSSKIGIGKLIPALITLNGEDQKKAICEFIFPTFFSIQKNIETLIACDEIFDADRVHIDRGGLYAFVSDIARIVIQLFKTDLVSSVIADSTTLGFLSTAFDINTYRFDEKLKVDSEFIYQEMIDDEDAIRRIVLEFIVAIQAHENLFNYSLKRDSYYKQFLMDLTRVNRFKGVDPIDISKILAGCLLANEQLQPTNELIEGMIDEELFNNREVMKMRRQFIDTLSPGIIYRLIGRLRVSLQHISKSNFGVEFQDIQKFSVKTILKNVWSGFINLVEKGLSVTTGPFLLAFSQIKRAYDLFSEEEKIRDETVTSSMFDEQELGSGGIPFISKNLDAFSQMTQNFHLVETDVISFRGEHEGATYKDFGYNTRLFRNDEKRMVQFLGIFRQLFKKLITDDKVKEITYASHQKIREYYAAYQFDRYLFCLGLTHIKNPKLPVIEEKSIFPYTLLFVESKTRKEGKAVSRTIKKDNKTRVFNEIGFSGKTAKIYYEALYMILHLLQGEDWEKKATQTSIAFLTNELNRAVKKKEKLLYNEGKL